MLSRVNINIKYTSRQKKVIKEMIEKYLNLDFDKLMKKELKNVKDYKFLNKDLNISVKIPQETIAILNVLSKYKDSLITKDANNKKILDSLLNKENLKEEIKREIEKKRPREVLKEELLKSELEYSKLISEIDKKAFLSTFEDLFKKHNVNELSDLYEKIKKEKKERALTEQEKGFYKATSYAMKTIISFLDNFAEDFKEEDKKEKEHIVLDHIINNKFLEFVQGWGGDRWFSFNNLNRTPSIVRGIRKEPLYKTIDIDNYHLYLLNNSTSKKEIDKKIKEAEEINKANRRKFVKKLKEIYNDIEKRLEEYFKENEKMFPRVKYIPRKMSVIGIISYAPVDYYTTSDEEIEVPTISFKDGFIAEEIRKTNSIPKEWEMSATGTIRETPLSYLFKLKKFKEFVESDSKVKVLYNEMEKLRKAIKSYNLSDITNKIVSEMNNNSKKISYSSIER